MKAVIQRVSQASVEVNNKIISNIAKGLVIFVGINYTDTNDDIDKLYKKILKLRIFSDNSNKTNLNVEKAQGSILLISQFTLCADINKGNRPSFKNAMGPEKAKKMFDVLYKKLRDNSSLKVKKGQFGAMMHIKLNNIGPMTIIVDTHEN